MVNVFSENSKRHRGRGRPPGRTAEGEATRERLYAAAIELIGERGYEAATLRDVAARAGVSPGLLYRYFPSKRAVVLALYDALSDSFARQAAEMPPRGRWRDRFLDTLELSLRVLGPHRVSLRALVPVIVGGEGEGIFSRATAFSRVRVLTAFQQAVTGATDAPERPFGEALGRLLYVLHLAVILWWLLDRSAGHSATAALVRLLRRLSPSAALALRVPAVRSFVKAADALVVEAFLRD
jgi:AcrR family transcriptional regulator